MIYLISRRAHSGDIPPSRSPANTSVVGATMAAEAVPTTAAIQSPILLRAPNGAEVWTIIELQGSIESKASNSLNGVEFAQLSWEPNTVSHARAHRPRRSTACTLAPARCRPRLSSSSASRRRQALGRTSRSRWSSSIRSKATHATMRVRPSLRPTRMVVPTRLTTIAPPVRCPARGVVRRKLVFKARPKPITRTAAIRKRIRLDGPEAPGGQESEAPVVPEVPGASS